MGRRSLVALLLAAGLLGGCGHKQTADDNINHIQQTINQAEAQNCAEDPGVCE